MAPLPLLGLLSSLLILHCHLTTTVCSAGIHHTLIRKPSGRPYVPSIREAPSFRNGQTCGPHDTSTIHVSMTLDANYLRGTMAAVLSILQHSTCPENFEFHFLCAWFESEIISSINSTFPYLKFKVYRFDSNRVRGKISKSIRQALDQPLNYARIYLADMLPVHVNRVVYLDSDLVVVDDIAELWEVNLEDKVET